MNALDATTLNFSPASLLLLNLILGLVMFGIALDLTRADFRALMRMPRAVIAGLISQFLFLPAATYLLVLALKPQPSIALGLILVAACPGGNISNFMTHHARGNAALSVTLTAIATLVAIVMTPLNLGFWGSLYEPTRTLMKQTSVDPARMAITVFLLLGLPLVAGMVVRERWPGFAERMRKPMRIASLAIFAAFVVLALAANWPAFLAFAGMVAALVFVHNAIGLCGGYAIGALFGLAAADRRAISIETGIQNSGLGLILIFSFFNGLGGMAVAAAFWGIWHIISGLAVAEFFRRRPT